jgi:hypothetical protein
MQSNTNFSHSKNAETGMNSGVASFLYPFKSIILEKSSISLPGLNSGQDIVKIAFAGKNFKGETFSKMIFDGQ